MPIRKSRLLLLAVGSVSLLGAALGAALATAAVLRNKARRLCEAIAADPVVGDVPHLPDDFQPQPRRDKDSR
jgi:hypothetical protein